jgi:hypothetical protein
VERHLRPNTQPVQHWTLRRFFFILQSLTHIALPPHNKRKTFPQCNPEPVLQTNLLDSARYFGLVPLQQNSDLKPRKNTLEDTEPQPKLAASISGFPSIKSPDRHDHIQILRFGEFTIRSGTASRRLRNGNLDERSLSRQSTSGALAASFSKIEKIRSLVSVVHL